MMNEKPILFNAAMVNAILDGRKTQTRRVVKNIRQDNYVSVKKATQTRTGLKTHIMDAHKPEFNLCPFGEVGDQLWVRETFREVTDGCIYKADYNEKYKSCKWKPSIHMPRWTSRIQLEITNIRVERLQDISEGDAKSEGVITDGLKDRTYRKFFKNLWQSINGADSWDENPYVWVIEFERIKP